MVSTVPTAAVAIVLLLSIGCSVSMSSFQSPFFSKFSLKELVQRSDSDGALNCSAGGAGDGIGIGAGGFGMNQSNFHRSEGFSCQMRDSEQFDEAKLIKVLQQNLQNDLEAINAQISSIGTIDETSFYFEYAFEGVKGRVEVSGARSTNNLYTLKADLDEKTGKAR